ncbi:bifunctional precorrin-2 dehydrogenase/sirohydrochlorin ferrochelatase [Desulfovibrio sp. OttesenSCG-928-F07]|nr:bifunctional precorrin-2 dehydrogenase/sirohydrochlorin ferrochelatase [Desulfovibrio sp. OttesenSCG-928-F07]
MRYYPVLFKLDNIKVMVAGAGSVGFRKATDVLAASPKSLLWLDPGVDIDDIPDYLRSHPALVYEQRGAVPEDVEGCGLVFAATGSREVNKSIADFCHERGVPCNVVDDPCSGNFIVPSYFVDGELMLALSTGGLSPALAKIMRREMHDWFIEHYRPLLVLLGRLRPLVLAEGNKTDSNTAIFRGIARSGLKEALSVKDGPRAKGILQELLPPTLHSNIEELLHGLY